MRSRSDQSGPSAESAHWLDRPRNVKRLIGALVVACALVLAADLLPQEEHHFGFERWFGFYAWFGFLMCVGLVLSAKLLRRLVKRAEDYYG